MRVKICGLSTQIAIEAAVEAGADWLGLVFHPASPRAVTPAQAAVLTRSIPAGVGTIGLLVSPDDQQIADVLRHVRLDGLQIYATAERVSAIRRAFDIPVWWAVGVTARADLPASCAVDAIVIEAKPPPGASRPGGHGLSIDASIVKNYEPGVPWLLAGGLSPDNVGAAIRASGASAVDVSSGVETAPGIKDPGLIRRFIQAARSA